jgi:TonB family protein
VVAFAVAAVIILAVVVPARFGSKGTPANDSPQRATSMPSALTNSGAGTNQGARADARPAPRNRVPDVNTEPPGAERGAKSAAAASGVPTLSPTWRTEQRGSTPLNDVGSATRAAANRRLKVGRAVKPPKKLVDVKPDYPDEAQAAGIEGTIVLTIVIGTDGSVIEAGVLRSVPELDQAAIDAVRQWQFEPTLLNGEPIEVEMNVVVNFTLS